MESLAQTDSFTSLQAGYRAVALEPGSNAPLRLSLVVKDAADPLGGPFVLIRDSGDASVYLGCVTDFSDRVHEWLEIWVQNLENLESRFPGRRHSLSNADLDKQWIQRADQLIHLDADAFVSTGWETSHPRPLFFDLRLQTPIHPTDKSSGAEWLLCVDDAVLTAAGLPAFQSSLDRYLTLAPPAANQRFVPVTRGAPTNESTVPLREALGTLVPFNPGGGLMIVRKFAPLSFEEWLGLLAGEAWKGVAHGKKALRLDGAFRTMHDLHLLQQGSRHWLTGQRGQAGRLLESFFLKLQTLSTAFRAVREFAAADQLPFLNLEADSFRVRLTEVDDGLPVFWTGRTSLCRPSDSIALPVTNTQARYFAPAAVPTRSVYRPAELGGAVSGRGIVRIREVITTEDDLTSIQATLVTQEDVRTATHDLLWVHLPLPFGRLELYGHFGAAEGSARGEARFQTLPQKLSSSAIVALREGQGVPIPHVEFETVPVVSTPCDLYALAVLCVRALFVDDGNSLPIALDEVLSFARLAAAGVAAEPVSERLRGLSDSDPKWLAALGPQRLLHEEMTCENAAALFPLEIWWESLALIMRCFPGVLPESFCRDYGDAPPLALHKVFDLPIAELDKLLLKARSLIIIDWQQNREIRSVIQRLLERS